MPQSSIIPQGIRGKELYQILHTIITPHLAQYVVLMNMYQLTE